MSTKTTAYILGDNISTDQIHPPRYFSLDIDLMKQGFLRGISEEWSETIAPGSIIIAGENFGCGSSRELTAQVFRERGIILVLAVSFARIFYRNLINLGIATSYLEAPWPWQEGTSVEVDFDPHERTIISGKNSVSYKKQSPFVARMHKAGGLLPLIDDLFS